MDRVPMLNLLKDVLNEMEKLPGITKQENNFY